MSRKIQICANGSSEGLPERMEGNMFAPCAQEGSLRLALEAVEVEHWRTASAGQAIATPCPTRTWDSSGKGRSMAVEP